MTHAAEAGISLGTISQKTVNSPSPTLVPRADALADLASRERNCTYRLSMRCLSGLVPSVGLPPSWHF
jgi:hypothetical protein